jgi:hypothetical protein
MIRKLDEYKPAVTRNVLLFLAGFLWAAVGLALLATAGVWFHAAPHVHTYALAVIGVSAGLLAHHFGFLRMVDKNLERLLPLQEKRCLFSFIPWKSYVITAVMIAMGSALRHSRIPRQYLATVYTAIGLALSLSSVRYIRVFFQEIRRDRAVAAHL